ncbi:MAG: hypothetical protein ABH803_01860 [Candidatus Micrarchaeota archaeon]
MASKLEKLAYLSLGSLVLTKKKLDAFVDELIDVNALSEDEGRAFVSIVLRKARSEEKKFVDLFGLKEEKKRVKKKVKRKTKKKVKRK